MASFTSAGVCAQPLTSDSARASNTPVFGRDNGLPLAASSSNNTSGVVSRPVFPNLSQTRPSTCLASLQTASDRSLTMVKSLPDYTAATPSQARNSLNPGQNIKLAAGKRRLGMGRLGTGGYPNKKTKGV